MIITKTEREIQIERNIRNKRYSAYISREIASKFDEKIKKEGYTFTDWLKNRMKQYLEEN